MMKKCENCGTDHDGEYGSGRFCSSKCARGFSTKSKRKEINKKVSKSIKSKLLNGNQIGWCKLNLNKTIRKCKCGNIIMLNNKSGYCKSCMYDSAEYKLSISIATKRKSGGYRKGSGRGKSGWYNGIWCDSSYELAWVIYQLEHGNPFERNTISYEYEWNGEIKNYIPDFIQNGNVIEIKGFVTEQTKVKMQSVPSLIVLFRRDLEKEFQYTESKYGRNFIELYDENPHKIKKNKCKVCGNSAVNIYCSRRCAGIGNNRNSKIK